MKIKKWFSELGIKQKVQYIFMLAIGVCILVCFLLFYLIYNSQMTSSVIEKSQANLSFTEQNFNSVISNVNNISKLLMVNEAVTAYLKNEKITPLYSNSARSEIYNMLNSFPGNYSVFVFRNDKEHIHTGIGIINADKTIIFDKGWFDEVSRLDGGYVLISNTSEAFTFNIDTSIISFARIINDIDTQLPLGMLVINIPVSELEQTYSSLADEDNHIAYIDKSGCIICADDGFDGIEELSGCDSKALGEADTGFFINHDFISSIETDSGFVIVSKSSVRTIEGISIEFFWSIFGILGITIAAMVAINSYIKRNITIPISKLADSMQQAEKGMLRRVSIKTNNDEIGELKETYNHMLIQINRLIDAVIEREQTCQKAELDALQEQIKPHFLYNTLNTIGYMLLQCPREDAYDAIETLGNFYRKFLSKGNSVISVNDEILIVRDYIKLQKLRYEDMFEDSYDISVEAALVYIPKLILQPLVENSIYHGIRPKGEKGIIAIKARVDRGFLIITVYDSGIGMNEEQINTLMNRENKKSFGFKGTIERIRCFYRKSDVVKIKSVEGEFCEIELSVPCGDQNNDIISIEHGGMDNVSGNDS